MRNIPYVKKYDKNGNITNPIGSGYFHNFQNRHDRRQKPGSHKFIGNHKGIPLTVVGAKKYLRTVERHFDKDGIEQKICNYQPR